MSRSTAKYLLLLVLAVVLFYWKTLLTNQFTLIIGSEGVDQTYAWLHFWVPFDLAGACAALGSLRLCRQPFRGCNAASRFYPLRLLFALVPLNRNGHFAPLL